MEYGGLVLWEEEWWEASWIDPGIDTAGFPASEQNSWCRTSWPESLKSFPQPWLLQLRSMWLFSWTSRLGSSQKLGTCWQYEVTHWCATWPNRPDRTCLNSSLQQPFERRCFKWMSYCLGKAASHIMRRTFTGNFELANSLFCIGSIRYFSGKSKDRSTSLEDIWSR